MKMNLSPRACGAVRVFNLVSYAYEHARNRRLRPYLAEIVGVPAYIMLRLAWKKTMQKPTSILKAAYYSTSPRQLLLNSLTLWSFYACNL